MYFVPKIIQADAAMNETIRNIKSLQCALADEGLGVAKGHSVTTMQSKLRSCSKHQPATLLFRGLLPFPLHSSS